MAAAVAKAQGSDGLWRANLADPEEFPNKESSGSGFFCYALAWGINNGILDRDAYLPAAQKAWTGLVGCLSPEGKVEWGQDVGDRPVSVKQDDSHEYVAGTFLLAGSEMLKLGR
jgi:rhamnogalacturonyl hydrolase YesR